MTERIVAAFVPLVDCAVLVAAREQGFAAEAGLDLVLVKEPSWASLRDHLCARARGLRACVGAAAGRATLGVGHVQVDCIAPFVLGRGGNAVTVSKRLFARCKGCRTASRTRAEAGRALAAVVRRRAPPLTLGMVFPFSNHNFDLRYWLAAAGLHPDRDVRLVAIPPPLMVDSLRAGPRRRLLRRRAVEQPCRRARFGINRRDAIAAVSASGRESARDADGVRGGRGERRRSCCRRSTRLRRGPTSRRITRRSPSYLARPAYLDVPQEIIAAVLGGRLRFGVGRGSARSRLSLLSPPRRERAARSRRPLGVRADGALGAARAERARRTRRSKSVCARVVSPECASAASQLRRCHSAVRSHRVLVDERAGVSSSNSRCRRRSPTLA